MSTHSCCSSSLELAKEEEERLKREEALRQATMSRHIVEKLKSLDCSEADIQQQQEDMGKVSPRLLWCTGVSGHVES